MTDFKLSIDYVMFDASLVYIEAGDEGADEEEDVVPADKVLD